MLTVVIIVQGETTVSEERKAEKFSLKKVFVPVVFDQLLLSL